MSITSYCGLTFYFAGSIRGGRQKAEDYKAIIMFLSQYGHVLTEHVGDSSLSSEGEVVLNDIQIYERDVVWIRQANILVADVTIASLGVGYEIRYAEDLGKKVICLYQTDGSRKLSAMISGNKNLQVVEYSDLADLETKIAFLF